MIMIHTRSAQQVINRRTRRVADLNSGCPEANTASGWYAQIPSVVNANSSAYFLVELNIPQTCGGQ